MGDAELNYKFLGESHPKTMPRQNTCMYTLVAGEVSTLDNVLLRATVQKDTNASKWSIDLGGIVGVVTDNVPSVHAAFNCLPLNRHLPDCCQT